MSHKMTQLKKIFALARISRMFFVPAIAVAIFAVLVSSAVAAGQFNGAIFTTNSTGAVVNQNHFTLKEAVFLSGGPQRPGNVQLPKGTYYFQVTDPSGAVLLSSDPAVCRQVTVGSNGKISGVVPAIDPATSLPCAHVLGGDPLPGVHSPNGTVPVQLFPFSDTPNKGGVYKSWLIARNSAVPGCTPTADGKNLNFTNNCAKTDNFQVARQAGPACSAWHDDFSKGVLDTSRWIVANGPAPGNGPTNISIASPNNISLAGGLLTISMTQLQDANQIWHSTGGAIYTGFPCRYGAYEWTMRMSSQTNGPSSTGVNLSGGVSSGFIFGHNSETEIAFEYSALAPGKIWFVNFWNRDPNNRDALDSEGTGVSHPLADVINDFHNYKFVWRPGVIYFYIDNHLTDVHMLPSDPNVPSAPAAFYLTHFGRDFQFWGGPATAGTRYFFVKRASYTP